MTYEFISKTLYHGRECTNFRLNGRDSLVVRPTHPLPGNPVCWRTEFFGAFDSVDVEMLKRGWHLCYHRVSNMYGCDESLVMMHEYHDFVCQTFSLNTQAVLFGFSRGGLYAVNYAAKYPDRVSGLYLDAPVCDIRSWPCANLECREAKECLEWYHLTPETLKTFNKNPIDKVAEVVRIPTIIVAGDSDRVVPYINNGQVFADRFKALGGKIATIVKPGCDHHPHSLDNPVPVADFIEDNCNNA